MRLWTLHPSMMDAQGLVALWREGLGAQKALLYLEQGRKFGYQSHPQLQRFKDSIDPLGAIVSYLHDVHSESVERGYKFNVGLLLPVDYGNIPSVPVTSGQVKYEHKWLLKKLKIRSPENLYRANHPILHPLFHEVPGDIEPWEKIQ